MHYVIEEENNATLRTPVLLSRGAKKFYGHTGLCSGVRIGNSTILEQHYTLPIKNTAQDL